jgi:hypothetical protein
MSKEKVNIHKELIELGSSEDIIVTSQEAESFSGLSYSDSKKMVLTVKIQRAESISVEYKFNIRSRRDEELAVKEIQLIKERLKFIK